MKQRSNGGFTLIELLMSIGIIGLLVATLLPTLTKAKWKSRTAKNKNNLKQIGVASALYEGDNRCRMVSVADWKGEKV